MASQQGTSHNPSNGDGLAASPDPQTASLFLAVLPLEVRKMIYKELWRTSGLCQHLFRVKHDAKFSTCPCFTNPKAYDLRYDKFMNRDLPNDEREIWNTRLKSDWNVHWACGELDELEDDQPVTRDQKRQRQESPLFFVPIVLACKRLYIECTESLYECMTFCFTDTMVAKDFLSRQPVDQIQSVELSIRLKPIITELYYPSPEGGSQPQIAGFPVTAANNPWENLCKVLCTFTNLRYLRIYLESEDLRPWHSRVAESKFLKRLSGVKAKHFILDIPELPDEEPSDRPGSSNFARRWERPNPELADMYLTADKLDGLPFTVIRGPRPDNWRAHLTNLGQRGRRGSASRFYAAPSAQGLVVGANVAPF